mmetsp:Transcript_29056/g.67351  ORF Transcript_29056/g.67351 Transcript_29056/m.67351 type:complete len:146 (-) Transcript_29056:295-732(-)
MGCLKRIANRLHSLCSQLFPCIYDCLIYSPRPRRPASEVETLQQDKVDVERQIRRLRSSIARRRNLAGTSIDVKRNSHAKSPEAILLHYEKVLAGLEERRTELINQLWSLQGEKALFLEASPTSSISTSPTLSGSLPRSPRQLLV